MIDRIFYINLEHREDRKISIEKELKKLKYLPEMIEKIDAVKRDNGAYGCALSHLKVLEIAMKNSYECVMIVEDDLCFKENIDHVSFRTLLNDLEKFPNFDICCLTCSIYSKQLLKVSKTLSKAISLNTTTGYIVKKKFFKNLYDVFKESKEMFEKGEPNNKCAIDIRWKKLQGKDSEFYVFDPVIAFQKPSYSDIEKGFMNYKF